MGQEIKTTLRFDGRIHEGTVRIEGGALIFQGGVTLNLPLGEIFSAEANAISAASDITATHSSRRSTL